MDPNLPIPDPEASPPPSPSILVLLWRLFVHAFWLPALVLAVHGVAALGFDGYDRLVPLDVPMHLAGGLAIAWAWARGLEVLLRVGLLRPPDRPLWYTLVFALTCTAAVFWELAEWLSDTFVGTNALAGLGDTILDMALGIAGGIVYLAVHGLRRGR